MNKSQRTVSVFLTLTLLISAAHSYGQESNSQLLRIQKELEEIRGLKFKSDVPVEKQSIEDFGKYLDHSIEKQFPAQLNGNYGKILRLLGLYRGPEIKDFKEFARLVLQSQAAAYYDPERSTFFLVMQDLPEVALHAVYAHELFHGLQDQYYNLTQFLRTEGAGELNDDESLARQAVVEGEATYLMTLWALKQRLGIVPDADMLGMAIKVQASLDASQLLDLLKENRRLLDGSSDLQRAADKLNEIPHFMLDSMIGAYMKGMGFVSRIQQEGWEKVNELYTRPPVSTEQILHPEKWLKNERPLKVDWPSEPGEEMIFRGWKTIETNTLGELQWRIVFAEQGLRSLSVSAARGWNGDHYSVMERLDDSAALMLLLWTNWDSEKEAIEFAQAYRQLLPVKYEGVRNVQFDLRRVGTRVLIVEGGSGKDIPGRLDYLSAL